MALLKECKLPAKGKTGLVEVSDLDLLEFLNTHGLKPTDYHILGRRPGSQTISHSDETQMLVYMPSN